MSHYIPYRDMPLVIATLTDVATATLEYTNFVESQPAITAAIANLPAEVRKTLIEKQARLFIALRAHEILTEKYRTG